jgi:hypothetical protein
MMNPRVKFVNPTQDYVLEITFSNNEKKKFDIKPYLNFGLFSELKDLHLFQTATAELGTVTWKNGLDICPDTLYIESK